MYFRFVHVDDVDDGKLSRVRIDAMRQMQVVVLAPLIVMGERWAGPALIVASLPMLLAEALISRRLDSMVAWDNSSERFALYPSVLFRSVGFAWSRGRRVRTFHGHTAIATSLHVDQSPIAHQPSYAGKSHNNSRLFNINQIKDDGGRLAAAAGGSASPVHWCYR